MSKKELRSTNPFDLIKAGNDSSDDDTSMQNFDADIFGSISAADANRQSASPVNIFEIFPDPAQPRRAIPAAVRKRIDWNGNADDIDALIATWIELVNEERPATQPAFDLAAALDEDTITPQQEAAVQDDAQGDEQNQDNTELTVAPLEAALVRLVQLAVSIRSEGLTNPITVVPAGMHYRLETGERRWLAYHLLYWHTREQTYQQIAARTVQEFSLWRQAAENNARANLNAIGKARQLAVLLMDLRASEADVDYRSFGDFVHEQSYYAQVSDGTAHRIPRGMSERLLNATGLKSPKQLRDYRGLLRLPHLVWEIADDLNWSERAIRTLERRSQNEDDLIWLAVKRAKSEGYTVPMGAVPEKPSPAQRPKKTPKPAPKTGTPAYGAYLVKLISKASSGKGDPDEAVDAISEFRRWLDEQETRIKQRQ